MAPTASQFSRRIVISIRREGGHSSQEWTFDGWFLLPARTVRPPLIFEGGDLADFAPDSLRRWHFDGRDITLSPEQAALWRLHNGLVYNPAEPSAPRWQFDGSTLEQDTEIWPDRWLSTSEVPLLVIAFVAGLL